MMLDSEIDSEMLAGLTKIYKPQYVWLPDHRLNEFRSDKFVFSGYHYSLVKLAANNYFPMHK